YELILFFVQWLLKSRAISSGILWWGGAHSAHFATVCSSSEGCVNVFDILNRSKKAIFIAFYKSIQKSFEYQTATKLRYLRSIQFGIFEIRNHSLKKKPRF